MNRLELISKLNEIHSKVSPNNLTQSLKHLGYSYLKEQIIKYTQYLPPNTKFKIRYYHILHGLDEIPVCVVCDKTPIKAFGTIQQGYLTDKCRSCAAKERSKKVDLGKILRKKYYWGHYDYLKNDYDILTTYDDFVETGVMEYIHKDCGKKTKRNVAYRNGCKWCAKNPTSQAEIEIRDWLSQYVTVENNKRVYLDNEYEMDIYLPDYKIGIEYHGLWYHSENAGVHKQYHLDKLKKAETKDIHLIQIFENEWTYKKDIVKSVILSKIGIYENRFYARKCKIDIVDNKTKNKFLDENHLQGRDSSSDGIGLFYNNELLSVMTFGKRNIGKKIQLEMLRYCCKKNTQIIGGASKLFNFYINNYKGDCKYIKTFADKRYSDGGLYEYLGFVYEGSSPPNYWYFKKNEDILYHRSNFMKHKLFNKLDVYDDDLTEYQNMVNNNYNRIFDCGNNIYKYKLMY